MPFCLPGGYWHVFWLTFGSLERDLSFFGFLPSVFGFLGLLPLWLDWGVVGGGMLRHLLQGRIHLGSAPFGAPELGCGRLESGVLPGLGSAQWGGLL